MIAGEDKHASSQRCIHWILHCPKKAVSPTSVPKMVPYKHSGRPDLDAVYMFDLKIAQDRGLKFCHTRSFAIILFNTMPTEASVKVMKFNRNDSETDSLFDKRPPQVTEVTRIKDPAQPYFESAGEARCELTVNKFKAVISTSQSKENENSHQTTRIRKRPH